MTDEDDLKVWVVFVVCCAVFFLVGLYMGNSNLDKRVMETCGEDWLKTPLTQNQQKTLNDLLK